MKLHFLGANRQVTGSRYCLEVGGFELLIDCGLVQERPYLERNWDACPVPAHEVDAVLLTHIHIDHSGLLPRFVREGFRGPIYTTRATEALLETVLRDAAKIQGEDVEYKRKRHRREGRKGGAHPPTVLFDDADVDSTLPLVRAVGYERPLTVGPGVTVLFRDAGHVLGSAMIEVTVERDGKRTKIVFSGDIGQHGKPLIRDPSCPEEADYVVMESTYGDREHPRRGDVEGQLADVINETIGNRGNVVIPTFAVERAQELMFYIGRLVRAKRIPAVKVFLDSPMAVDVTEIYRGLSDFFDEETLEMMAENQPPLRFPGLTMSRTVSQSRAINNYREPCIIMASSGMCNAGRIKHHLRQNLGRTKSTILFVGHQGEGTLGRQILNGAESVRIHGQDHPVRARIAQLYGFSGHADRSGLLRWIDCFKPAPKRVFLTHGEESVANKLAAELRQSRGLTVDVPAYRQTVELD